MDEDVPSKAMHTTVLVALALLVAGCTAPPADDPMPTGPDTGDGSGDGHGLPDGTDDPHTRPADGETPPGLAPQGHHDEAEGVTYPGIHVEGTMDTCEAGFCVDATAVNQGTKTVHVHDICVSSWSESMTRGNETVQHQEPRFHCAAFGTAPMEPGDRLSFDATWDEQVWDGEEATAAPEGAYEWHITFRVFGSADGGDPEGIGLTFPVVVGET